MGTPSLDQEMPVPEDWSILVEKATQLPDQPPPPTRQQQMAQQQQGSFDAAKPLYPPVAN
jgi:hypothetical protein